MRINILLLI